MYEPTRLRSLLPGLVLLDPETGRPGRPLAFVLCLITASAVAAWFRPDLSLPPAALRALFILVLAVLLWVTEVVPDFAVGILVIALSVALLGRPAQSDNDWEQYVRVIGHPLIWLFFGGFVLAAGMERCGLDRRLALGNVVTSTGLSDWIVGKLPVEMLGPVGLAFLMAYVTVILSNFMSNTAAANILIPLVVTMAAGFEATVAIAVALGAPSAMCLPVATPPNAMVFATGRLTTWDLVRVGLVVGLITPLIGLAWLAVCLKIIF